MRHLEMLYEFNTDKEHALATDKLAKFLLSHDHGSSALTEIICDSVKKLISTKKINLDKIDSYKGKRFSVKELLSSAHYKEKDIFQKWLYRRAYKVVVATPELKDLALSDIINKTSRSNQNRQIRSKVAA